jgi:hypothetical protein
MLEGRSFYPRKLLGVKNADSVHPAKKELP